MQKRRFDRIYVKLKVKFFCSHTLCSGNLINFSERGMLIHTNISFPFEWKFDIFILLKEKLLRVPVQIIRLSKGDSFYDTMAVEVLDPAEEYKQFIREMKLCCMPDMGSGYTLYKRNDKRRFRNKINLNRQNVITGFNITE